MSPKVKVQLRNLLSATYDELIERASRIVKKEAAGDVVHDVVVRYLEDPPSRPLTRAFLHRAVYYGALSYLRSREVTQDRYGGFLDETHADPDTVDPETAMLRGWYDETLENVKSGLDEDARCVLDTYFEGGCTVANTSILCGLSVGRTHRLLVDSISNVRTNLGKKGIHGRSV